MAMPKKIRVGHAVLEVRNDATTAAELTSEQLAGSSNGNFLYIRVRNDLPYQTQAETLLHEVLHMVLFFSGLDLDADQEEKIVRPAAMTLYGVLKDNPQLLKYLLEEKTNGRAARKRPGESVTTDGHGTGAEDPGTG
jgi:hypothetical protein